MVAKLPVVRLLSLTMGRSLNTTDWLATTQRRRQSSRFPLSRSFTPLLPRVAAEVAFGDARATEQPVSDPGNWPKKKALAVFSAGVNCASPPKWHPCATWNPPSQEG